MHKNKLIILDRDGTINIDKHYLSDPDKLELLPDALEGLQMMAAEGFHLAIATNQSGIGRGYFDLQTLHAINDRLLDILKSNHIEIETIAYCPHKPDDNCGCRKPKPGMAHQISDRLGIPLNEAFVVVIGDREGDIGLAHNAGAKSILICEDPDNCPDYGQTASAISLKQAVSIINKML